MKAEIINLSKIVLALFVILFAILISDVIISGIINVDPSYWFEAKENYGQLVGGIFYISKYCFIFLIFLIILELSNFFLSHVQKLKNILRLRNIIFLFIIAIILFFIMSFYPKAVVIIQPFFLFLLLFIISLGVIWSLKQLIYTFKTRISILIILAMIFFLTPLFLQNYHFELFYRLTGKIITKEIGISLHWPRTVNCLSEMPAGCAYIRTEFVEIRDDSGCRGQWECPMLSVNKCIYGCPK